MTKKETRAETIRRMENELVSAQMPGYVSIRESLRDLVEAYDMGLLIINKAANEADVAQVKEDIAAARALVQGKKRRLWSK